MKTGLSFESPVLDFGCLGAARVPVRRLPPPPGTRPRTEIAAVRAQRAGHHRVTHPGQERLFLGRPPRVGAKLGLKIHHLPTPRTPRPVSLSRSGTTTRCPARAGEPAGEVLDLRVLAALGDRAIYEEEHWPRSLTLGLHHERWSARKDGVLDGRFRREDLDSWSEDGSFEDRGEHDHGPGLRADPGASGNHHNTNREQRQCEDTPWPEDNLRFSVLAG